MNNLYRPQTGVAYFGNRYQAHFRRDLDRLAPVCDHVVHTVSETDLYFHKRAMASLFKETRDRGLDVWADPWGLGGVFGGESFSRFLLDHPDSWQVLSNGRRVPAACLRQQAFRDFAREWLERVADWGAQVIFWDEPHVFFHWDLEWEGTYACRCSLCADLFARAYGRPAPDRLNDDARAFRRDTLRGFLAELFARARELRIKNALCLYAFEGYAEYDRIWESLGGLGSLDIFGTDPYWRWRPVPQDPASHVRHYTEKVLRLSRPLGRGSQIWIQAMRLPRGKEGEILTACRAAAQTGATHITAWSYDGGELLDPVLSEEPAAVWLAVEEAFREIRGGVFGKEGNR